jgi:hypothetical protein
MAAMFRILLLGVLMTVSSLAAADLRRDLEAVAQRHIFFAHQSVGANILEGVRELSAHGGVRVRIDDTYVERNGEPLRKLANFAKALGEGSRYDIALLKFCYVDIGADTDAAALFARYRTVIDELRGRNPRTTFVHVTLPLTTVQTGMKALAKRALGRDPSGTVENVRREEYNALLRKAYAGREPVFDLARLESTGPDGAAVSVAWRDAVAPALSPAWTDDGGHLNQAGRLRAARELLRVLASAPVQEGAALEMAARRR